MASNNPTEKSAVGVVGGMLFFRLKDGSSVTCECIKEPFASKVVEACERERRSAIEFFWTPPHPGERIIGMTAWRDIVIVATDHDIYTIAGPDAITDVRGMTVQVLAPGTIKVV